MKKSSKKQDRTRYPLPNPIDDGSRICVKLWIPNIDGHRQALIGAIYNLTRWYSWQLDDEKQGIEVAAVWQPIFYDMMDTFYDGCPDDNPCFEFPPSAAFIEWFPNNPYTEPDLVTDGYNAPAWYEATPASNLLLGTQTGDIVTDLTRFPPGSLPSIIPASGLPRFRINLVAPGVVTIHLLNIIAGSLAQITIDDDISTLRFIDMNRDQIAAPFETATTTPVEVEVLGAGAHHIDVIVVSQINDEIPFLHHGGGLRKVEICGEAVNMPFFELRTNPDDPCSVQQRLTATGEWTEAFRMDNCCDDEILYERYSPEGIKETSPDGETWTEDRGSDPRFYPPTVPPLPGEDGDDKRCQSANNVTGWAKYTADDWIARAEIGAGVSAVLAILVPLLIIVISGASGGALTPLMLGLAAALASTGASAFSAAMTSEVYEIFNCIVYCNTPDDGVYTEANWQTIKAAVLSQLTGIAATFLHDQINALGIAGMNNAARTGVSAGLDCDSCICDPCLDCTEFAWTGSEVLANPASANVIWHGTMAPEVSGYVRYQDGESIEFLFDEPICIDKFRMPVARGTTAPITVKIIYNDDPDDFELDALTGVAYTGVPSIGYEHVCDTPRQVFSIKIEAVAPGAPPADLFLHGIELHACTD